MADAIEVVVADDDVLFAEALAAALRQAGYAVRVTASLTECADALDETDAALCVVGAGLLEELRSGTAPSRPPGTVPTGHVAALLKGHPQRRVVVLTADRDPDRMLAVLGEGAAGYVHRARGLDVLVDVLRRVRAGETAIEGTFVRAEAQGAPGGTHVRRLAGFLTQRELETLALLVEGLDTGAIAGELGVSRTTVRTHVQSVLAKLGVHSRLEAVSAAVRHGLVDRPVRDDVRPSRHA